MSQETSESVATEQVPREGITIEFSFSTNPAYEAAVATARKHPSYRQLGDGTGARHRAHYRWQELAQLQELKDVCWELREKRAYVNGIELRWEHMAQMTYCFYQKLTRGQRDHCFFDGNHVSPFGCRYTLTNLADRISNQWLTYGEFQPGGAFRFDKERIRALAKERLRSAGIHFCPAGDEEFLDTMVEVFPDQVNPDEDTRWRRMLTPKREVIGVVPVNVRAARDIVHELQGKVRARRGPGRVDETGKLPVPAIGRTEGRPERSKRKSLLEKLFGK